MGLNHMAFQMRTLPELSQGLLWLVSSLDCYSVFCDSGAQIVTLFFVTAGAQIVTLFFVTAGAQIVTLFFCDSGCLDCYSVFL